MKPNHLFSSMLALATIVVTSCSAPRMAQQSTIDDDVYNSVAQAREYTPVAPSRAVVQNEEQYDEDDYYGTSDPYYDMDYSSRINRFHYGSPWRTYYDPYFYDGWGMGSGWGHLSSPLWGWNAGFGFNNWGWNNWGWNAGFGFNNWGWNNWGWNNYYGGGFLGGGFYGGGFGNGYLGSGYYTGRTTNVPNSARPARGSRDGYAGNGRAGVGRTDGYLSPRSQAARAARENVERTGRTSGVARPSRTNTTAPTRNAPTRTEVARPSRESAPAPTYTPSRSSSSGNSGSSSSGSSRGSSGGGGSTGGGRTSRGGR